MSTPERIRVAAAQYPLDAVADTAAWLAKLTDWIEAGAATGADLLVFPEYGAMEAAIAAGADVAADLARSLDAVSRAMPALDAHLSTAAVRRGLHILGPSGPVREGHGWRNRALLHAPSGRAAAVDKTIMTPFEQRWGISGGAGPVVVATTLGRIGIAICYDSEFPLLGRAMAEAGANMLLIPSCTEHVSGFHRVRIGAEARALENQIATVMSPTVGTAPWSAAVDVNTGAAGIFIPPDVSGAPTGVIAQGVRDEPGWVAGDIDVGTLRRLRATGEMHNRADWAHQPGAAPLPPPRLIDLT
jgi:predicted amidohydrolase